MSITMTLSERHDRLDSMIAEGRLVRRSWGETTDNGRETACLLAALSPEAGARGSAGVCPAQVMPEWLAHLTCWIDDAGSEEAWSAMALRYAALARRWHVLTTEDWRRLYYTVRRVAVEEAVSHIPAGLRSEERAACVRVVALCRRAEAGDDPTVMQWKAASWATEAPFAPTAAWAAARVARMAARAARAEHVVADAAEIAGRAADMWAAREAATDRITDAILDAINAACDRRTAVVS